jgi:transposase
LIPTAKVSALEVVLPKQCRHCGGNLPQKPGQVTTEGEPRRHQVTEVPPVKAHVTEYQFPNLVCGDCGKATRAPLPEEMAGHFGPQLTALIAYWTVACRLPRRLVEAMPADVLGIEISLGSTQKAWEEVSQAVQQPVQQLQEQLPREAVLNVDEIGLADQRGQALDLGAGSAGVCVLRGRLHARRRSAGDLAGRGLPRHSL